MRGNSALLARMLAIFCDDLAYAGASQAEREAALVMGALHAAIVLERTAELAALVEGWAACPVENDNAPAAVMRLLERRQQ